MRKWPQKAREGTKKECGVPIDGCAAIDPPGNRY
jgi:hypothetical protein